MAAWGMCLARAEPRRYRIALANLDETPGVTLDGLGSAGADVRSGFEAAARQLPVDMMYFDNAGDPGRAVANADAAIANHVDLLIEYNADAEANAEIAPPPLGCADSGDRAHRAAAGRAALCA